MRYQFSYVFPFYKIINLILYPIIIGICIWVLNTPPHQNANRFDVILTLGSISLFLFGRFIQLLLEWYRSKDYKSIEIDYKSIRFPFLIEGKSLTWNFNEINFVQFSSDKNQIRKIYFIELSKKGQSIRIYKSWMRPIQYNRLIVILKRQNIEIEPPV